MDKTQQTGKNRHKKPMPSNAKLQKESTEKGAYYFLDLDDCRLLLNAMKQYKPTKEEEQLYEIWLEMFDEELWSEEGANDEE
jgi:hypothetical protein